MNFRIALFLVVTLTGCSALRRPGPEVDRTHDTRIRAEVLARFAAEPHLRDAPLRIEVDGGLVHLYGSVRGMGEWDCAIRNAQLVANVASVVDFLQIERGPRDIQCRAPREMP